MCRGYLLKITKSNSNYLSVGHAKCPFQDKVNKREKNRNNFIYIGRTWRVTKVKGIPGEFYLAVE